MAEAVSLQVIRKLIGSMTQTTDLSTAMDAINRDYSQVYSNGTGASQANMWWHDQRTLTASATEDLDCAASLTSVFGTSITFTSLKGIIVFAATANTNNVNVIRPASNGVPIFLAAGDGIAVKPGMVFEWFDPSANGALVTAGSGDLITFTNSAGSTSVTYDVFLLGEV